MPVLLAGATSGVTTVQATDAVTATITLPSATGTLLSSGTAVTVAQGGTGATTLTSGSVLVGAGTSAISSVAPGTSGNLLTSNGSAWVSSTPAGGGVTSLNGQTGAITNTSLYAIGGYVCGRPQNTTSYSVDSTIAGSSLYAAPTGTYWDGSLWINSASSNVPVSLVNTGTWRCVSPASQANAGKNYSGIWVRIS